MVSWPSSSTKPWPTSMKTLSLQACVIAVVTLQHLAVVVLAGDLAAVDATLVVAPLDHRLHRVGHLFVEAGRRGVARVVAVPDGDRRVGHAVRSRALRRTRAAR